MKLLPSTIFFLLTSVSLFAAEFKVGVVDEQVLITKYERAVDLLAMLKSEYEKEKGNLTSMEQKIMNMEKSLMTAGESKRKSIELEIKKAKSGYRSQSGFLTEIFGAQENHYTMLVLEDIEKTIEKYGKAEGYTFILRKGGLGKAGGKNNLVLYSDASVDITEDVLKVLNAQYDKDKAKK